MTEGEFPASSTPSYWRTRMGQPSTDSSIPNDRDADASARPGRLSPLHEVHVAAGASFTDFAGWQMPVRYASELEEHRAVREAAGLFDLSHMAEILVTGPEAGAALDFALSNVVSSIEVGQARYSLLLSSEGGVVDDVIVYRTHEDRYGVVANAGNRFEAAGALSVRAAGFDATVVDESDALALVAVQGPASEAIMLGLDSLELPVPVDALGNYRSTTGSWRGDEVMVARTGYTGEDGFEIYIRTPFAQDLWNALISVGAPHGLVPAGIACRDTLRLEAGMPPYGNELGLAIRPAQAGLGCTVRFERKGDIVGRSGYPVFDVAEGGEPVGEITSGALSPTLGRPIAMAFVDPHLTEPGTELFIDVRGRRMPASVTPLPFYKRTTQRKVAS